MQMIRLSFFSEACTRLQGMMSRHFSMCLFLAVGFAANFSGAVDEDALFLPRCYPAKMDIDVIDMVAADQDHRLTATTLQGLVNRQEQASLYLLLAEHDVFWLAYLKEQGFIKSATPITFEEALKKHASQIQALVIHDTALPASINIATMIAAEQDGIVVSPEQLPVSALPGIKQIDLRARWKNNAEAYRWAIKNLLPVMNRQILACYHPTACGHRIRDYLVQHKVFHFWASSKQVDALPSTDSAEEREVVKEILASTLPNIPVLGFWYAGPDPGLDEYNGVGLAGTYGKITVVCDLATNLSLLGGVHAPLDTAVDRYQERLRQAPPELDRDKVYLCIDIVESGDSPSYVQNRMYKVWQEKRGSLPVNWSLGPAILDLAPSIAQFYYAKATDVDYLYMSLSGAGYCHPYRSLFAKTADPDQAWEDYLALTRTYQARMRTGTISLYTDAWKLFDRSTQDKITERFVKGLPGLKALVLGMGRDEGISPEKANYYLHGSASPLVSHIMTRWSPDYGKKSREENIAWLVADIRDHTPETRPAFIHVMALSWVFGPSELQVVLEQLGADYVPLTIPQFTGLFEANMRP